MIVFIVIFASVMLNKLQGIAKYVKGTNSSYLKVFFSLFRCVQ